ncbi:MAG: adenylyltransferase/cytidyltransferase family protein [Alkalispirochaeta sp.]
MNGVIIGRFMPPHSGHLYLIDFARHMVDRLYILVCTLSHEPIPGELRYRWVQELAPECETVHITEEIPEARRGAAGATAIWARTVRDAIPDGVARVFASEEYGWDLARELKARFVPVDPSRNNIPVSATAIRRDPYGMWRFIPPVVRPWYVRHLAVVAAPEVTEALAAALKTVVVHSYRTFLENFRVSHAPTFATDDPVPEEIIRDGATAAAVALARHANRILLYDLSDPHELSGIKMIDGVVTTRDDRDAAAALVPERPIFDAATVTVDEIEQTLLS